MQPQPWPRLPWLFHFFVFAVFIRFGEATNPGPTTGEWTLGCMNPTGIMHKSSTLSQLPARGKAVWGISETHLTQPGVTQFRKELHFSQSLSVLCWSSCSVQIVLFISNRWKTNRNRVPHQFPQSCFNANMAIRSMEQSQILCPNFSCRTGMDSWSRHLRSCKRSCHTI